MPSFDELKAEYTELWQRMVIRSDKSAAVTAIAKKLIAHKERYLSVADKTGVPWFVIAALHNRESGADFATYLGNGEPLSRKTRLVPKGRGPFVSWEEGAIDAIRYDGLDEVADWTPAHACFEIEKFNGFGYCTRGTLSPYLWSFTNHYARGKFVADGKYDATAIDAQCGAMPALKRIMELDSSAKFSARGAAGTGTAIVVGAGGAVATKVALDLGVDVGVIVALVAATVIAAIAAYVAVRWYRNRPS